MNRQLTIFVLILAGVAPEAVKAQSVPITFESIYKDGGMSGKSPEDLSWSPDSSRLTFITDDGNLMQLEASKGKQSVLVGRAKLASLKNANSPEQDKDHRTRYNIAGYIWGHDSKHLLFDSNGQMWIYDLENGAGVQVGYSGAASGDDPKFAPDGSAISFIRNHELAICELRRPGTPTVNVSSGNDSNLLDGEVDWLYLEELGVRSNYFWSPDSKSIAYLQTNESAVPEYPIVDWIPVHAEVERQRYPQPGDNNPAVRLGVVGLKGGKTVWMKVPIEEGQDYIPRFGWVNPKTLWIETLSRDHKHLNIYFGSAATGNVLLAVAQTEDKFFDESYDVNFKNSTFALSSWRDGHTHLYLYSFDYLNPTTATLVQQITSGNFEVNSFEGFDESQHRLFYVSNESDARQRQLWSIQMDGTGKRKVSQQAGSHEPTIAPESSFYFDAYSTAMTPKELDLCNVDGRCTQFWQSKSLNNLGLTRPQNLEVKASDGTLLYATLLLPSQRTKASVPLIVNPYGGPGSQTVADSWSSGTLFDQLLAQHGYAVLHVDNRGMANRGRQFAQAAYHNFGPVQLEDQLRVVDEVLAQYPQLDAKRLGWWGWSWGGTFTLNAMTHSARWIAGVAVAPVTDWHNYDSIYAERYLGGPAENPDGYRDFSVVNGAQKFERPPAASAGNGDDNVHLGNSIQFIDRLIEADILYDLQLYPRKTHSISGEEVRSIFLKEYWHTSTST